MSGYDMSVAEKFSFSNVMAATTKLDDCVKWCIEVGMVRSAMVCSSCATNMRLKGGRWRCHKSACNGKQISARKGSELDKFRAPLPKIVRLIYCWASQRPVTKAARETSLAKNTAAKVYAMCRDLCSEALTKSDMKIGGEGCIVEIDETSLKQKAKYNRGRIYPDCWLFGGVDRVTGK
ncbi:hypothetical protein LEN26_007953 [Aphanomyces euteiches]|nr:hypothetical protein AeMF1_007841 [Aphanomyces euteiches]KAH9131047.1 hypothetical protein LEN26_007953 [Aphanomyces euteiches]KAH9186511.1 hypothetical protein AeNC1_011512 [Aphanomyces euteiches]